MNGVEEKLKFEEKNEQYFFIGIGVLTLSLVFALIAFFQFNSVLRYLSFSLIVVSLMVLCFAMIQDIKSVFKNHWLAWGIVILLLGIYFMQRMEFHRFDFMVGDASDYFATGMYNVTYSQNVGYIVPYAATLTAIGYDLFGIEYVLLPYVVLYANAIPLLYFMLKKLDVSVFISLFVVTILIFSPLSIWYAKSTFSETIWQILLIVLMFSAYSIVQKNKLSWGSIFIFYTLLFIAPLLRAEGILLYGLIIFVALVHYWKHTNLFSSFFISLSVFLVALSAHWALILRPAYLLDRQYSRIIPDATTDKVMMIIYSVGVTAVILLSLLYFIRKKYSHLKLFPLLTAIAIVLKPVIAYVFSIRKDLEFLDLFVINEFELAVGNFGLPITLLMVVGLFLLYYRAFRGGLFSLVVVMVYTVLYIPYVMQSVTFIDPHAFFLYWNRYYFAIIMIIHLLGLGLVLDVLYQYIAKYIKKSLHVTWMTIFGLMALVTSSMNYKFYKIAVNESHLKGSQHLYSWVRKHIPKYKSMALVTQAGLIYKQNARPDGLEQIEYFAGRGFSFFNIYEKGHQRVNSDMFTKNLKLTIDMSKIEYVLLLSKQQKDTLYDERLVLVDTFTLPLEWREHFGLDNDAEKIHHWEIEKSVVKKVTLYATLYRVVSKFKRGNVIKFTNTKDTAFSYILKDGWTFIKNRNAAFSPEGKGTFLLPKLKDNIANTYSVNIRYAIINASKDSIKSVNFSINGEVLKEEVVMDYTTKEIQIDIPKHCFGLGQKDVKMDIETSPRGQIMLRSITINTKGKQ